MTVSKLERTLNWKLVDVSAEGEKKDTVKMVAEAKVSFSEFGGFFGIGSDFEPLGMSLPTKPKPPKKLPKKFRVPSKPKRVRKGRRAGKKLSEMSIEERRAYWREMGKAQRDRKAAGETAPEPVSENLCSEDEKFYEKAERIQALQKKIDKVKAEQDKIYKKANVKTEDVDFGRVRP